MSSDDTDVISIKNRASVMLQNGQTRDALGLLEDICRHKPDDVDARFLLADTYGRLGQYAQVLECCNKILTLRPGHVGALIFEGMAMTALGRHQDAAVSFRQALERKPHDPAIIYKLGYCMLLAGELRQAEDLFRRTLSLQPNNALAHLYLARTLVDLGRYPDAYSHFNRATECDRQLFDACMDFGAFLTDYGDLQRGEAMLREALRIQPGSIKARRQLATNLRMQGRYEDAIAACDELLRDDIGNADVMADKAEILERKGDLVAASRLINKVIDQHAYSAKSVSIFTDLCGRERPEEAISLCQKILAQPERDVISRQRLHYAMGKLLDQLGRYNEAFAHYQNANDLAPDHFDAGELADRTDRLMTTCSRDALAGFSKSMLQSGPVFIVGMPRSGTTLLEQILSSHPGIHGAGELMHISEFVRRLPSFLGPGRDYPECLAAVDQRMLNNLAHEYMDHAGQSAGEAKCIIDKMPQNYLHLGLIQMLFPNARILHCLRHPLDTCLSNYFQSFHAAHQYANRLKNIATYYRHYWRLMRHWKSVLDIPILDIVYEKLVDDQETVSRKAVQFCGMPWDERCLRFHETKKLVITASYRQVRQPLYRSSMARWKKYEAHLAELTDELGDVLTEYEQKYSSPPGLPY